MTSCTFINCVADYDPILKLNSRATTITHVCCTFLEKEVSQDTNLFIESEVAENSFFQLIYSSFKGVNTDSYIRSNSMFLFQGRGSLRYQCVNLSECDLSKALTSIAPLSLIFQMNTFYKINTNIILYLNIQGGSDYYYANLNYVGSTNFIYDSVDGEVVFLDMHVGTNITFDNCVFYLVPSSYSNNIAFRCENPEVIPLVINCFFDEDIVIAFGNGGVNLVNKSVLNYPYFLDLAHYVVPGICDGEQKPNAYGCNNNECPSHVICIPDAFSFHPNDYTYTLIFHPDINTPSPSPTESFSHSNIFSESNKFSESIYFSNSFQFSFSSHFSKSSSFNDSCTFTSSNQFNPSDFFSNSNHFTFSTSFSKTSEFSNTEIFSNSNDFNQTDNFTKSKTFTPSNNFSSSSEFSSSIKFSETSQFTSSLEFTKTFEFTNSFEFSLSDSFTPTKTNVFTNSIIFTKSSEFTSSHSFTQTPTQSIYSNKITIFQSLSQSFTHVKSVSFSLSYAFSIYSYDCMNEEEQSSICFSNSYYFTNVPYLIMFLSKTFIPVKVSYEIQYVKKRITGEQLIGIVCGSVACLFSILGIILFIVRKKYTIVSSDFLENSSSEIETNIQSTEKEVTFNISEIASNNLDNWL